MAANLLKILTSPEQVIMREAEKLFPKLESR
jgi:hypothetical protein